jgi:flagellar biosynthesis protein FlhB
MKKKSILICFPSFFITVKHSLSVYVWARNCFEIWNRFSQFLFSLSFNNHHHHRHHKLLIKENVCVCVPFLLFMVVVTIWK